jgi:hypothetical protein
MIIVISSAPFGGGISLGLFDRGKNDSERSALEPAGSDQPGTISGSDRIDAALAGRPGGSQCSNSPIAAGCA